MSQYYNVNGLKIRVSDHEPNERLRGSNDIELYVRSASNELLSIEGQIEYICEKRGYNIADFQEIINDWKDGSYDINVFRKKEDEEVEYTSTPTTDLIFDRNKAWSKILENHTRPSGHAEIKELSEKTGVSQSYIKNHFNIR